MEASLRELWSKLPAKIAHNGYGPATLPCKFDLRDFDDAEYKNTEDGHPDRNRLLEKHLSMYYCLPGYGHLGSKMIELIITDVELGNFGAGDKPLFGDEDIQSIKAVVKILKKQNFRRSLHLRSADI